MTQLFKPSLIAGALLSSLVVATSTTVGAQELTNSFKKKISNEEIRKLGLNNVYQLLEHLVGFSNQYGVARSAQLHSQYRGKSALTDVAVYLDGIRLNSHTLVSLSEEMPFIDVNMIDSVSFLSGGQSARHGSGAGLGAIYIQTTANNQIALRASDQDRKKFSASAAKKLPIGELSLKLASEHKSPENVVLAEETNQQFYINWQHLGFDLSYLYSNSEKEGGIVQRGINDANFVNSRKQYVQGQYSHTIDNKVTIDYLLNFNSQQYESAGLVTPGDIAPFSHDYLSGPDFKANEIYAQATLSHQWREDINYKIGVLWQDQKITQAGITTTHLTRDNLNSIPLDIYYQGQLININEFEPYGTLLRDIETVAIWGDGRWQIDPKSQLKVAGRLTDYKEQGSEFSYTFGYAYQIAPDMAATAQLSNGFRQASHWQLFVNTPSTLGKEDLSPVSYQTTQIKFNHDIKKLKYSAGIYHLVEDESIVSYLNSDTNRSYFVNQSAKEVTGLEGELSIPIDQTFSFYANANHALAGISKGGVKTDVDLNLSATIRNLSANASVIYQNYRDFDATDGINSKMGDILKMNVNVAYQLGRSISMNFALENITDEAFSIIQPGLHTEGQSLSQPGRTISFGLSYAF